MIRVKFTLERPSLTVPGAIDEFTIWAHVDLDQRAVTLQGGRIFRGGTMTPPAAASIADLILAGLRLDELKATALHEAALSRDACEHCAAREALKPGTLCGPCTVAHGELPAEYAQRLTAFVLAEFCRLSEEPVLTAELRAAKDAAQALVNDAAARAMRAPTVEVEAAQ